jgi:hypothetical protein
MGVTVALGRRVGVVGGNRALGAGGRAAVGFRPAG